MWIGAQLGDMYIPGTFLTFASFHLDFPDLQPGEDSNVTRNLTDHISQERTHRSEEEFQHRTWTLGGHWSKLIQTKCMGRHYPKTQEFLAASH